MLLTEKALRLYNKIENDEDLTPDLEELQDKISCSDGFEYGLLDSGYIDPKDFLAGDDLKKFEDALDIYREVKDLWEMISIEM